MLEVRQLTIRYGQFIALEDVDLEVRTGEIVGLIGANGAGKSSLLRAIAGLVQPSGGSLKFAGAMLGNHSPETVTKLGISLVPEGRGLFPAMSVEENLMMGGYSIPQQARIEANMSKCYGLFPVLLERRRQLAGTLSGGQQQMLAISMGIMSDPKLLILDEPSLGLAPIIISNIGVLLKKLRDAGITVLLSEQNATLTGSVADRIYVLQTGHVRYHDTPARLFATPDVAEAFLSI